MKTTLKFCLIKPKNKFLKNFEVFLKKVLTKNIICGNIYLVRERAELMNKDINNRIEKDN